MKIVVNVASTCIGKLRTGDICLITPENCNDISAPRYVMVLEADNNYPMLVNVVNINNGVQDAFNKDTAVTYCPNAMFFPRGIEDVKEAARIYGQIE